MTFEWWSPMRQAAELGDWSWLRGPATLSLLAHPTCEPTSLLKCVAQSSFWKLPAAWCHALARDLGLGSSGLTSFGVRELLVRHIRKLGEVEAIDILKAGISEDFDEGADLVYELVDVGNLDALDKNEQQEIKQAQSRLEARKHDVQSYRSEFREYKLKACYGKKRPSANTRNAKCGP